MAVHVPMRLPSGDLWIPPKLLGTLHRVADHVGPMNNPSSPEGERLRVLRKCGCVWSEDDPTDSRRLLWTITNRGRVALGNNGRMPADFIPADVVGHKQ